MCRQKHFYSYHITSQIQALDWAPLSHSQVWEIFSDCFYQTNALYPMEVNVFVLMSNHFHLLISMDINQAELMMSYLRDLINSQINAHQGRDKSFFKTTFHYSIIKNLTHYHQVYKYIYRNPVHAGLCRRVEEYSFSSLRGLLGGIQKPIPVVDNMNLIQNPIHILNWLNTQDGELYFNAD